MKGIYTIILGSIILIWGLLNIPNNDSFYAPSIMYGFLGVYVLTMGVFEAKDYRNKTYHLVLFSITAIFGLISLYRILFIPFIPFFYYTYIGVFILYITLSTISYLNRHENSSPLWKNEW